MMQLIYFWSKKIHRILMWLAILLGVPVAVTGVLMESETLATFVALQDWGYRVRVLHRMLSTKFALVLLLMMVSGFLLWLIPKLRTRNLGTK
jgi:hypothetical protein